MHPVPPFPRLLAAALLLLAGCRTAHAHQVPNMTVEADFAADGGYEMRVNLDPRTFLSRNPTSLAPLDAAWYLEQSPAQQEATRKAGAEMLRAQLRLWLREGGPEPLAEMEWQPLDGATNTPMREDTEEVHLLATLRGRLPEGAGNFTLEYDRQGQVSLILLTLTPDSPEPRVQVIFPGERSRPVKLPAQPPATPAPQPPTPPAAEGAPGPAGPAGLAAAPQPGWPWWWLLPCVLGLGLLLRRATRR